MESLPWKTRQPKEIPATLAEVIGGNRIIGELLVERGLVDPESVQAFFDPELYLPAPGDSFKDLLKAVDRIFLAIEKREIICVWGDFDVDGQTSTALLFQALHTLGANVIFYIPDRIKESHGVNLTSLSHQLNRGATLIITCDTGITANEAVDYASELSVDTIITDHHELPSFLPNAFAIINPHLLPPGHPMENLPGVGVAYILAQALYHHANIRNGKILSSEEFLDLVAIGIIADVAVLIGDTRYLAQRGIKVLQSTNRAGLLALFEYANIRASGINEETIGFTIGPRLNSLGRLSDAKKAVEFLTTNDHEKARIIALELESLNSERQFLTQQVYRSAKDLIEKDQSLLKYDALVLSNSTWSAGIIGIVANRLVADYGKPVVLFTTAEDGSARGSARSAAELNIIEAIEECSDLLVGFGGHRMAAGLSIRNEKIPEFRHKLSLSIRKQKNKNESTESLLIDAYLELSQLSLDLAKSIELFAPFGPGNPTVIFATNNLKIINKRWIGKKKEHLIIHVRDSAAKEQKVLYWQAIDADLPESNFDLAYTIRTSSYQGKKELQIEWVAWRYAEQTSATNSYRSIEWIDFRAEQFPAGRLIALQEKSPDLMVWAECVNSEQIKSYSRSELSPSAALAIWTVPPDLTLLRHILDLVNPQIVYVFANDPGMDQPGALLPRMLGLLKHLKSKREKVTTLSLLASACAHSTDTIRLCLDYLMARELLWYQLTNGDNLEIYFEKGSKSLSLQVTQEKLLRALRETAAFRQYFCQMDLNRLLNS